MLMQLTEHERAEFARMGADAYNNGLVGFGNMLYQLADLPAESSISLAAYDNAMRAYRCWLLAGFDGEQKRDSLA